MQSDIDEFSKYQYLIDDQIKSEDLSFFFLVYNRFTERSNESKTYYTEILSQPFDFEKEEVLDVDYKKSPFAKNKEELIDVWTKQLKISTLFILHDKIKGK